nr:glutamyl-tRNA reductase [Actinomycetota bacterium]
KELAEAPAAASYAEALRELFGLDRAAPAAVAVATVAVTPVGGEGLDPAAALQASEAAASVRS